MYGTVVDVGTVAEACQAIAPDAVAFNHQWRAKQLEYTFLRSTMGKYQDFWTVTEQALAQDRLRSRRASPSLPVGPERWHRPDLQAVAESPPARPQSDDTPQTAHSLRVLQFLRRGGSKELRVSGLLD